MLHARRLEFAHPVTAETVCFKAPLHGDMHAIIELLKKEMRAR
jgi:hypothetical protein